MTYEQLTLGEAAKQRGMAIVETAEGIHGDWVERADLCIEWLARSGREFTAEDVRRCAGDPLHPNAMGARFHAAARRGLIRKVGVIKATRPGRHANEMRVWVGV